MYRPTGTERGLETRALHTSKFFYPKAENVVLNMSPYLYIIFLSYVKTEIINIGSFLHVFCTRNKIWFTVSRHTVYCPLSVPG